MTRRLRNATEEEALRQRSSPRGVAMSRNFTKPSSGAGVNRSTKCGRGGQESGHPACKHPETKRERDERWRLPTAATAASRATATEHTTAAEQTTAADSPAEPTLWNDTVSVGDVEIIEPMWAVKSAPVKVR